MLAIADLADGLPLGVTADGAPAAPLVVVDLDSTPSTAVAARAVEVARSAQAVIVGRSTRRPDADLAEALTLTVAPTGTAPWTVAGDPDALVAQIRASVAVAPRAAIVLAGLLRTTASLPVPAALFAESAAYSMLLSAAEHRSWRASHPPRSLAPADEPVRLIREGDRLVVILDRPERHNAVDAGTRDGLVAALGVAVADAGITEVVLRGAGPSFSSGGDLDEFGTAPDPATAHLVRLERSAGLLVHQLAGRTTALLHGACLGAGLEVPAFAGRVLVTPDAVMGLPELRLGLIPGAGGTVSVTRRIGRWRTAWLALSGEPVDADRALAWGLADGRW